jgi:hypothetical protein
MRKPPDEKRTAIISYRVLPKDQEEINASVKALLKSKNYNLYDKDKENNSRKKVA